MSTHLATTVIVGGFPLLRHGIELMLGAVPWLALCGKTGDAAQALELCEKHRPELVVLDLETQEGDGLSLLRDVARVHPKGKILAICGQEDAQWLARVFDAGAAGYLSRWDMESNLPSALLVLAMTDDKFVSQRLAHSLLEQVKGGRLSQAAGRGVEMLSARELEVFRLTGRGKSTSVISRGMKVSVKTVETHQRRIIVKLGMRTIGEMRRRATEWLVTSAEHEGATSG